MICTAKKKLHPTVSMSPGLIEKDDKHIKPMPIIAVTAHKTSRRSGFFRKNSADKRGTSTTYNAVRKALLPAVVYFAPIV